MNTFIDWFLAVTSVHIDLKGSVVISTNISSSRVKICLRFRRSMIVFPLLSSNDSSASDIYPTEGLASMYLKASSCLMNSRPGSTRYMEYLSYNSQKHFRDVVGGLVVEGISKMLLCRRR